MLIFVSTVRILDFKATSFRNKKTPLQRVSACQKRYILKNIAQIKRLCVKDLVFYGFFDSLNSPPNCFQEPDFSVSQQKNTLTGCFFVGGERGIRTLAAVTHPTPLAGAPLRPSLSISPRSKSFDLFFFHSKSIISKNTYKNNSFFIKNYFFLKRHRVQILLIPLLVYPITFYLDKFHLKIPKFFVS